MSTFDGFRNIQRICPNSQTLKQTKGKAKQMHLKCENETKKEMDNEIRLMMQAHLRGFGENIPPPPILNEKEKNRLEGEKCFRLLKFGFYLSSK